MHGCKHCTLVSEVRADVTTPGPKHDKWCPRYTPVVTVRVPDGVSGGDAMQVPTAKGAMAVTVPAGLVTADTFAMQLPRTARRPKPRMPPAFLGALLARAAARADAVPLPGGGAVPRVAAVLVERLHGGRDGGGRPFLEAEGLFRAPGEKAEVDDLAAALDGGDAIGAAAACADPLVLASCLKLYLRKPPSRSSRTPPTPPSSTAASSSRRRSTSRRRRRWRRPPNSPPRCARVADASAAHVELYELLLSLFAEIVAIPSNRMAPNALATCLAPALLRPAPGRRLSAEEEMADMRPIGAALTAVISNGVARPAGAKLDLTTTAPPPPLDAGERTPDDGPAPPGLRVVSADASSVSLSISGASRLDPDGGWRVAIELQYRPALGDGEWVVASSELVGGPAVKDGLSPSTRYDFRARGVRPATRWCALASATTEAPPSTEAAAEAPSSGVKGVGQEGRAAPLFGRKPKAAAARRRQRRRRRRRQRRPRRRQGCQRRWRRRRRRWRRRRRG